MNLKLATHFWVLNGHKDKHKTLSYWFSSLLTLLSFLSPIATPANFAILTADASPYPPSSDNFLDKQRQLCPKPALSRLVQHKVLPGETLESIAQQYNLIPATLMGFNPALQDGTVTVGRKIFIPPYNGIRVEVPASQTWQQLAAKYKIRAGTLFEVNGCQKVPREVFVPGVNWAPERAFGASGRTFRGYPLPKTAPVALGYGWQINPSTGNVFFNSGLDLLAKRGTPVAAVDGGTVAFAGEQGSYGNLVVVNHQEGQQTRYAHLNSIAVHVGQEVKQGDLLGTVGSTGKAPVTQPHLHFEVRYHSSLGWVAEDPSRYFQQQKKAARR